VNPATDVETHGAQARDSARCGGQELQNILQCRRSYERLLFVLLMRLPKGAHHAEETD